MRRKVRREMGVMLLPELREVTSLIDKINRATQDIRALARRLEDDTDPKAQRPDV